MGDHNGVQGHGTRNGTTNGKSTVQAPISATAGTQTNGSGTSASAPGVEYYILCPQRDTEVPGLITHLISRDICEKRQSEHYHKCPNCVRSRIWRERNGLPAEEPAAAAHG
jgi:hypothetical protein